jgi:ubiquinone/menaquinone biosynthesis C-methylase UbiE
LKSDTEFWHRRYQQQVGWSLQTRRYIFKNISIAVSARILEVGCGTGALLDSLHVEGFTNLTGLDIDLDVLSRSAAVHPSVGGGAVDLPFADRSFDLTICHFLLLWLSDPGAALLEMKRVTMKGGWIIALGEPDYGGSIDYPPQLAKLGRLQTKSLEKQGADPLIGRTLHALFHQAGLTEIHSGIIGAEWTSPVQDMHDDLEWEVLRKDLAGSLPEQELNKYLEIDRRTRQDGTRVLFVPVFYTYGRAA